VVCTVEYVTWNGDRVGLVAEVATEEKFQEVSNRRKEVERRVGMDR